MFRRQTDFERDRLCSLVYRISLFNFVFRFIVTTGQIGSSDCCRQKRIVNAVIFNIVFDLVIVSEFFIANDVACIPDRCFCANTISDFFCRFLNRLRLGCFSLCLILRRLFSSFGNSFFFGFCFVYRFSFSLRCFCFTIAVRCIQFRRSSRQKCSRFSFFGTLVLKGQRAVRQRQYRRSRVENRANNEARSRRSTSRVTKEEVFLSGASTYQRIQNNQMAINAGLTPCSKAFSCRKHLARIHVFQNIAVTEGVFTNIPGERYQSIKLVLVQRCPHDVANKAFGFLQIVTQKIFRLTF